MTKESKVIAIDFEFESINSNVFRRIEEFRQIIEIENIQNCLFWKMYQNKFENCFDNYFKLFSKIKLNAFCTNRVKKVCVHFVYFFRIKNFFFTSPSHISIIIQSINKMFFKSVTNRRKLISKICVSILVFREKGKSYDEIIDQLKFVRSIVIIIVYRVKR